VGVVTWPTVSLRYAVNEEAASYLAIMRTFTGATAGLLSDPWERKCSTRQLKEEDD